MIDIKRSVKFSISLIFLAVCWIRNALGRFLGVSPPTEALILYYHSIPKDQRLSFAHQMDMLLQWATPVRADFEDLPNGQGRFVAVTFDDGFVSFVENALPELEKRNIPATLFVVTDRLGCYPDWPEFVLPDADHHEPLMTSEQLRQIPELITIGSHTLTHPTLTNVTDIEARQEIFASRVRLEKMLKRNIRLFSFPNGKFNESLVACCREAGYERVFTILPRPAVPGEFAMGRVWANPTDWHYEFLLKMMGAYDWLPMAFALKRRLLAFVQ
jgi:peptidoglycan/xylan/chitin deacetylase (PgdA/CDA1 family)